MHLISFSPPASRASSASPAYPPHKIALLPPTITAGNLF
ncbi:hypothetical protein COO91_01152 [Nostoc flagelliforme CCNUN1]|uniref:Uncharacterized protein n=1 Tax=Nostoc flagelliforme CCNUN1 TaxID=2038116 RepID=A0A2K8SIH4_9NOSO|nr:hypothetical protein COO91_01152 [Nostoc flagelliforme CCNUN1]